MKINYRHFKLLDVLRLAGIALLIMGIIGAAPTLFFRISNQGNATTGQSTNALRQIAALKTNKPQL